MRNVLEKFSRLMESIAFWKGKLTVAQFDGGDTERLGRCNHRYLADHHLRQCQLARRNNLVVLIDRGQCDAVAVDQFDHLGRWLFGLFMLIFGIVVVLV